MLGPKDASPFAIFDAIDSNIAENVFRTERWSVVSSFDPLLAMCMRTSLLDDVSNTEVVSIKINK